MELPEKKKCILYTSCEKVFAHLQISSAFDFFCHPWILISDKYNYSKEKKLSLNGDFIC